MQEFIDRVESIYGPIDESTKNELLNSEREAMEESYLEGYDSGFNITLGNGFNEYFKSKYNEQ